MNAPQPPAGALTGIRVVEMGQLMAGPLAGTILAYYGADVIKIEPPDGDPVRNWRVLENGTSLWWRSLGRNKRCVTLNLRTEAGRNLAARLVETADVLLENFRPGTMEQWGLGPEVWEARRPELIYARVSGYGQTGPYRTRGGYAAVCEAVGGLRHVTGEPGKATVRSNLSLGDSLAAMNAVIGVLVAMVHRGRGDASAGQLVDVSIAESVLGVMEAALTEYDRAGVVREPSGGTITGVAPTGAYPCAGGRSCVIGANGLGNFRRLMRLIGRNDLAEDEALATNAARVARRRELDDAIGTWTRQRSPQEVVAALEEAAIPGGPINTVADIVDDPHFRERGVLEPAPEEPELRLPALGPKLGRTPGRTRWAGPEPGAHNRQVFLEELGLTEAELDALAADGVC